MQSFVACVQLLEVLAVSLQVLLPLLVVLPVLRGRVHFAAAMSAASRRCAGRARWPGFMRDQ